LHRRGRVACDVRYRRCTWILAHGQACHRAIQRSHLVGVVSPSLNSAGLNGVSCVSRISCVAVGEQASSDGDGSTLIEQYSRTGWKVVPSPDSTAFPRNSNFLQSVSCSSAGECVAVGGNNNVYAGRSEEYAPIVVSESNEAWVIDSIASPTDSHFRSVSCSLMECVTVGDGTASDVQVNGGQWAPIQSYASGLSGVACGTSCTGVGRSSRGAGISVTRLVGMKRTRVSAPKASNPTATNTLNSVSCFDDQSCVAVGQFIGSESRHEERVWNPRCDRSAREVVRATRCQRVARK
jgi:hypothetical protein